VTRWPDRPYHTLILEHGRAVEGDGLEVVVYPSWYERLDRVAAALRASGLRFPVVHAEKSIGGGLVAEPEAALAALRLNCLLARELGAGLVVFHLWELPDSDMRLDANLEWLPACLDVAAGAGVGLAVETIPCRAGSPLENVRAAVEADGRCLVALDTEFLAAHDELEAALAPGWLWERGVVRHVHVKDYDGRMRDGGGRRRYLLPGEGRLDLDGFVRGVVARGYTGAFTLEASAIDRSGALDLAGHRAAVEHLRALVAAAVAGA
jgi:sugar phosphate isomerase/epimerase